MDGLQAQPLTLADRIHKGADAAVIGYPANGPLTTIPARMGRTGVVSSQDSYGRGPVEREMTPFRAALEASGAFTSFGTEYVRNHKITADWEVPPELIDQFQSWLAERRIQPSLREWISERDFIQSRLKTEIFNLALGVEKGDEVEAQRDPQIQKGLESVMKSQAGAIATIAVRHGVTTFLF